MWLGKWKPKSLCCKWLEHFSLPGGFTTLLPEEASGGAVHRQAAQYICHPGFHPHLFFNNQEHISTHTVKTSPPCMHRPARVSFLPPSTPQGVDQCGPSWGLTHSSALNTILQIQEVYLRCQWSWASDPVVAPGSSSGFLLAAKKKSWLSMWDWKTASPEWISVLQFSLQDF